MLSHHPEIPDTEVEDDEEVESSWIRINGEDHDSSVYVLVKSVFFFNNNRLFIFSNREVEIASNVVIVVEVIVEVFHCFGVARAATLKSIHQSQTKKKPHEEWEIHW